MSTYYKDIYKLITECESFNGSLTDQEASSAIADKLEICRVTYRIFSEGVMTDSAVIYTAPGAKLGDSYDFSRDTTDTKVVTIRIYRFPEAKELDHDDKILFNIFAEAVISGVCVRNLITSYENVLYHDFQTGLTNYNFYTKNLMRILNGKNADDYTAGFLNIKNFKTINKLFGADVGDLFIKQYSLEASIKVDPEKLECFSRFGGDNFAFIILNSNLDRLLEFLKEARITVTHREDILEYTINSRVGLVKLENSMTNPNEILTPATAAFALTRQIPGTDVLYYSENTNSMLSDQLNYAEEIRKALAEEKFLIYFQPVVKSNNNGTVTMITAEALIRWRRENQMVNPISFIPVAEKHNIISKIDFYVLEKTCAKIKDWIDSGLTPVPVSVNFSKSDLLISGLTEKIISTIDKYGIDHSLICVEFPEAGFHEEFEALCYASENLIKSGINVIIDNFGSGYSSLQLLLNLNFNYLKIDSSFMNSKNPKSEYIIESMIKIADKIGIITVCEGVSSESTIRRAMKFGCNIFQTEHFEKALSERYFINHLKNPTWKV
ncbi:MAG: GGDEF domain-containing protein [Clostridiales bacterium]|nr:GGDEF domain-containing protein [Clostridiales bacterium]